MQVPPSVERPAGTPAVVVRNLYAQIIKPHPIGIPTDADRAVIWPLLSERLVAILETASRCEADYLRQFPDPNQKPGFGWLEEGLFSGSEEMADPSDIRIIRTDRLGNRRYLVWVEFTYRETSATYCCRPPNPRNTFKWRGVVTVDGATGRYLIDDFRRISRKSGKAWGGLSEKFMFAGCRGPRWVGAGAND
jgi:hypothetical protein